jgi:uncharacterized protein (TIGR04562 family)
MEELLMLFSSRTLRSIIAGDSTIDLPALQLRTREQATEFLRAYGYDEAFGAQRQQGQEVRLRALKLLEEHILLPEESVPPLVRDMVDLPTLLLWASDAELPDGLSPGDRRRVQAWSCILLRVCHTVSHALNELNEAHGPAIRDQIAHRFEEHLQEEGERLFLGSGDDRVELVTFSVRPMKTIEAATMKLLRAVENVSAGIFDWVGVRLVVANEIDALLAVRYLRAHNVISYPNIIPGRCRNSLIDLDAVEPQLERVEREFATLGEKIIEVRRLALSAREEQSDHRAHNEHSSADYRAIQFTCREMVRIPIGPQGEQARFFFPYEVQILDAKSFEASESGPASHEMYKQRQWEAVRRRVLAGA